MVFSYTARQETDVRTAASRDVHPDESICIFRHSFEDDTLPQNMRAHAEIKITLSVLNKHSRLRDHVALRLERRRSATGNRYRGPKANFPPWCDSRKNVASTFLADIENVPSRCEKLTAGSLGEDSMTSQHV
ncbi:hypothetical protein EVAR_34752_1 [Eumeta japonica]|uniref:Uncharacterized protein n=1 Tax=Eumeta variegata TaxID=151549 RepID=A0A4C1YM18_EUMVA|nr:hypothetical protein EVAR_34752_1 [Eumeta japonica]